MPALDDACATTLAEVRDGYVVALTGAGISAESGIPTFRGPEGYWTVGAREYHPQEMATQASFRAMPREVWRWYLYRRGVCRAAHPNQAHRALAELETGLGERFMLVTQNVDGLHRRAGNDAEHTCEVHGNIDFMRCTERCSALFEVPELGPFARDTVLRDDDFQRLVCPDCSAPARPHVLWFDEYYDESLYRSDTAMRAVDRADLLLVVGSSGAASLPIHAASVAARNGAAMIDVNPGENPFAAFAREQERGHALEGTAASWVPRIAATLLGG